MAGLFLLPNETMSFFAERWNQRRQVTVAKAEIFSGACGFNTTVTAQMNGEKCNLSIESDCEAVQSLAKELKEVEPFEEISFKGEGPLTLRLAAKHCYHAACPVPVGIIKAVEVAARLALPADVRITFSESSE